MKSIKKFVAYWLIFTGSQISFYHYANPILSRVTFVSHPTPQDSLKANLIFEKVKPQVASDQFSFTEGPGH